MNKQLKLMMKDLLQYYKDIEIQDIYFELYDRIKNEDFRKSFALFHHLFNEQFGFMNNKMGYNHHFNADQSRTLIEVIDKFEEFMKYSKENNYQMLLHDDYSRMISISKTFLVQSGGSPIPENLKKLNIIKYEPIFSLITDDEDESISTNISTKANYEDNTISIKNKNISIKEKEMDKRKIKIFISHSSIDEDIMEIFVDLLTNVFENLKRKEIICTSVKGCKIEFGKDIYDEIKKSTSNSLFILGMFSHNLIKSPISLFEIGIGWANDKLLSIIVDESFKYNDLPKAIESRTTKKLFEIDDINEILDHLSDKYGFQIVDSNVKNKKIEEFIMKYSNIPKTNNSSSQIKLNNDEFEDDWLKDKERFENNSQLINSFELVYQDYIEYCKDNFLKYSKDLPILISLNLFMLDMKNNIFLITEKGKYYYKNILNLEKESENEKKSNKVVIVNDYFSLNQNSFNHDSEIALQIIRAFEYFYKEYGLRNFIYYSIISDIFGTSNYLFEKKELFIDRKLRNCYNNLYIISNEFIDLHYQYSVDRDMNSKIISIGNLEYHISRLDIYDSESKWQSVKIELEQMLTILYDEFLIFKKEIFDLKQEFEIESKV